MIFCPNCGTQLDDNAVFCANCGTPIGANAAGPVPVQPMRPVFVDTYDLEEKRKYKVLTTLCYLNLVFVILALVAAPDSKYVRFHANQALCLTVFALLASLCSIVPFLGWLVTAVCSIIIFVLTIIGIVNALKCRAKELGIVGKYRVLTDF